ncbi:replication protein O [Caballeronia sp. LjRoot29]|uniref:replication protein O n=1 Tax=Caballeronia sp. LjRoot29 TaxID=3342315 RepID=UPI003ED1646D
MLIAQLSVASEDVDRPRLPETPTAETDQDALEEFACDRSNLPWVIFRAAHRATHATALPARARAVLAALARTVDANRPYAAIFARRELLTGRAMQSMRTFYRSLDDLEAADLIVRQPQKRHGDAGLFGRAYLHLTEKATFVLGFVERQMTADNASATTRDSANTQAALSLSRPSATVADGAIYKDLDPKIQKRQSGTVPGDLTRLLNLGFHEFLIFKLMREAKLHSKILSDVVEATWEHLRKAERPINYLRTLLRSPVDFGHQIRVKQASAERARREHLDAIEIEQTLARCADQIFIDIAGQRQIIIGEGGASMTVHNSSESAARLAAGNWKPAFVAALNAGRIRLAKVEDQEAFAARRRDRLGPSTGSGRSALKLVPSRVLTPEIHNRLAQMKQLLRNAEGKGGRYS